MTDLNSFLADVPAEDSPMDLSVGEQQETDTPAESPEENKSPEESAVHPEGAANIQDEEEKLPFHKHPRWKEMYNKNKMLEEELSKMRGEFEEKVSRVEQRVAPQETVIPEDFIKLYGDNPEAFRLWQKQQSDLAERIKADIREEGERITSAERAALQEGEKYVEDSLTALEADGKVFDRNELMKFLLDLKEKYGTMPEDAEKNVDFARGLELMIAMQGDRADGGEAKSRARKDIASFSASSGSGRGEDKSKDFMTSQELGRTDWDTLIGK